MADKAVVTQTTLDAIGQAIIDKCGATAAMTPAQMPDAIKSIPSGGDDIHWHKPANWPDIRAIMNEKMAEYPQYPYADIMLLDANENKPMVGFSGGQAYLTSDGVFATSGNHYWDMSKDIDIGGGEKVRWIITFGTVAERSRYLMADYPSIASEILWIVGSEGRYMMNLYANRLYKIQCLDLDVKIQNLFTISEAKSLVEIKSSIEILSSLTSAQNAFNACRSLRNVPEMDLSSVTNCSSMFNGCSSLQTIPAFDLSACTNCSNMFYGCSSLQTIPAFDLSACTNCSNMFNGCSSLQTIPDFDLSACTNCSGIFGSCNCKGTRPKLIAPLNTADLNFTSSTFLPREIVLTGIVLGGTRNFSQYNTEQVFPVKVQVGSSFNMTQLFSDSTKQNFATFDENGNLVGGIAFNMNQVSGATAQFNNTIHTYFTATEQAAIEAAFNAKGWTLAW